MRASISSSGYLTFLLPAIVTPCFYSPVLFQDIATGFQCHALSCFTPAFTPITELPLHLPRTPNLHYTGTPSWLALPASQCTAPCSDTLRNKTDRLSPCLVPLSSNHRSWTCITIAIHSDCDSDRVALFNAAFSLSCYIFSNSLACCFASLWYSSALVPPAVNFVL